MSRHTQIVHKVKNKIIGISGHEHLLDDLAGYMYSRIKTLFDISHTMLGMWTTGNSMEECTDIDTEQKDDIEISEKHIKSFLNDYFTPAEPGNSITLYRVTDCNVYMGPVTEQMTNVVVVNSKNKAYMKSLKSKITKYINNNPDDFAKGYSVNKDGESVHGNRWFATKEGFKILLKNKTKKPIFIKSKDYTIKLDV